MQTSFTDLVGTTIVPAHCFDSSELTDLTPALDTATDVHDMAELASETRGTRLGPCPFLIAVAGPAAERLNEPLRSKTMQTSFTDLVGTTIVPAHCFESTELTDLTPALDTATAAHDMAAQASEASGTCFLSM